MKGERLQQISTKYQRLLGHTLEIYILGSCTTWNKLLSFQTVDPFEQSY